MSFAAMIRPNQKDEPVAAAEEQKTASLKVGRPNIIDKKSFMRRAESLKMRLDLAIARIERQIAKSSSPTNLIKLQKDYSALQARVGTILLALGKDPAHLHHIDDSDHHDMHDDHDHEELHSHHTTETPLDHLTAATDKLVKEYEQYPHTHEAYRHAKTAMGGYSSNATSELVRALTSGSLSRSAN